MDNYQIKVLVVEDESPLLKHIQKKIEALSSDFAVIGAAYNGKEALEIIQDIRPDIVFTDIKMPVMDGLELARILYEDYPDISTVIVSGYGDFEYARTVLSYRVHDYLLKPLQPDILKKVLFSLKDSIVEKKRAKVYEVLNRGLKGEEIFTPSEEVYGWLSSASFSLFLVCLNNLRIRSNSPDTHQEDNLINFSWDTLFGNAPFTLSDFWLFPQNADNLCLIVIQNQSAPSETAAHFIYTGLQQHFSNAIVNLAFDRKPAGFSQLHYIGQSLHSLLFSSLVIGHSSLIMLGGEEDRLPPAVLSKNSIAYFHTILSANNMAGFESALLQLFSDWKKNKYPQQWVDKVLTQLLYLLQQDLFFSNEDYGRMFQNVFNILEAQTDILSSGVRITRELLQWISLASVIPTDIENTIEEMDAFIRLHYREYLSLADLAEKYHFNHSYLTRVFKKQKGESPLRLINSLRIHDAKELLLNPQLSVKEISEMLGFSDQHYFSRSFKNFTGLSPNEYRNL